MTREWKGARRLHPGRSVTGLTGVWILCLALGPGGAARAQQVHAKDGPDGPVPAVDAVEVADPAPPAPATAAERPPVPRHPPLSLVRPMPLPDATLRADPSQPPRGIHYDATSRVLQEVPLAPLALETAGAGLVLGGGYVGADGGELFEAAFPLDAPSPTVMTRLLTPIPAAMRALPPWRMNAKLVMRFGTGFCTCSGTMRDAEAVLTAGHCVYNRDLDCGRLGWADEVWVYPGWDGLQANELSNPYGWAHGTDLASNTGWTEAGDVNFDLGLVGVTRAVGMLTGWFGWASGGDCGFWTSQLVQNASYPAESCGLRGRHNGNDMYFWSGRFDSCSGNMLNLRTRGGCFGAVWGGMSGSGVYYEDAGNRYVHAVTSVSNRLDSAGYARQYDGWVGYSNDTFIPGVRGAAFDLQPLDLNAQPSTIAAGGTTTLLNHLAANPTNGSAGGTWTFRVYLSRDAHIDSGDTLLNTQAFDRSFAAMDAVRVNMLPVMIPAATPAGDYYLGVLYDGATDANGGNNGTDAWDAVAVRVTVPDLVATVTAPASARPGDIVNVTSVVRNAGQAAAGAFRVGLYLSDDGVCNTGDTFLAGRVVAALAPGAGSLAVTAVRIPNPTLARTVCAIADDRFQVAESNEGNNAALVPIAIVRPDLRLNALSSPVRVVPGATVTVLNSVVNGSTVAAGGFRVGLHLSLDPTCNIFDPLLGSRTVPGLLPGGTSTASTTVTIPASTVLGRRYLCAIADDLFQVLETTEANNTTVIGFDVVPANPTLTLRVNGQHPTPPEVTTVGPARLTLDIGPSARTQPLAWFWSVTSAGRTLWMTPAGASAIRAPYRKAVPVPVNGLLLLNTTLAPGASVAYTLSLEAGTTIVASDTIRVRRP